MLIAGKLNLSAGTSWPLRSLTGALSPAGRNARLSILIYHRVHARADPLFPNEMYAASFEAQLRTLGSCYRFLPLCAAIEALKNDTLPARAACITFDDGYADNAEIALPILHRLGIPATFFIASGFLNGGRMWNDTVIEIVRRARGDRLDLNALGLGDYDLANINTRQRAIPALLSELKYRPLQDRQSIVGKIATIARVALPDNLMLSTGQLLRLRAAGMEIGSHTVNHPILATLDRAAAEAEIGHGKAALEDLLQAPVRIFAYPNGKPNRDYLDEHAQIAKKVGFDAAVTTAWGAANRHSNTYQLPRFTPWDRGHTRFLLRMAQNLRRDGEEAAPPP